MICAAARPLFPLLTDSLVSDEGVNVVVVCIVEVLQTVVSVGDVRSDEPDEVDAREYAAALAV